MEHIYLLTVRDVRFTKKPFMLSLFNWHFITKIETFNFRCKSCESLVDSYCTFYHMKMVVKIVSISCFYAKIYLLYDVILWDAL